MPKFNLKITSDAAATLLNLLLPLAAFIALYLLQSVWVFIAGAAFIALGYLSRVVVYTEPVQEYIPPDVPVKRPGVEHRDLPDVMLHSYDYVLKLGDYEVNAIAASRTPVKVVSNRQVEHMSLLDFFTRHGATRYNQFSGVEQENGKGGKVSNKVNQAGIWYYSPDASGKNKHMVYAPNAIFTDRKDVQYKVTYEAHLAEEAQDNPLNTER